MPPLTQVSAPDTATAILDIAERLVQRRGFNGFSYADIAAELGITKASLHYHFTSKAELGATLITRYTDKFTQELTTIDAGELTPPDKLRAYCRIYVAVLMDQRMCLCGMLAAEYETLPEPMRQAVSAFFDLNAEWLGALLDDGAARGLMSYAATSREAARGIIAALEGGMLISRPSRDIHLLEGIGDRIVTEHSRVGARVHLGHPLP